MAKERKKYTFSQSNEERAANIIKWNNEHPEERRKNADRAQSCRNADTFKQQGESMRETWRRKKEKFSELVFNAKMSGFTLDVELLKKLQKEAAVIVKKELAQERKMLKNSL